ncbi:helix-turn-helix domain-containing protein, partial [Anaerotruncus massiliensis (ex Liu et al. 2021)]
MDTLGARLNYARRKRGYTQNSLAEEIGVSRGVIYNLE